MSKNVHIAQFINIQKSFNKYRKKTKNNDDYSTRQISIMWMQTKCRVFFLCTSQIFSLGVGGVVKHPDLKAKE